MCFMFIASGWALIAIFTTHYIIDRSNLVAYLLAFKNNVKKQDGEDYEFPYNYDISNFGYSKGRPFTISVWLYIICDNLLHIICNYLALKYL